MDTRELWKKRGVGLSKAILIALYDSLSIIEARGDVRKALRLSEEYEDKVLGVQDGDPTREQVRNALNYLRRKKLIEIQRQYNKDAFSLTKLGRWRTRKLLKSFGIKRPKKWDSKWRMVIFDIPKEKKERGDVFREQLKRLGLANLQKSIWIHPFECRDQVFYLARNLFIEPYVRYIVAQEITGERDLKKRFAV